jgi:hypothetical protein
MMRVRCFLALNVNLCLGDEFMADAPNLNAGPDVERTVAAQQPQQVIEPESLEPLYANFARVSGLPEELILDFGLNPQPAGTAPLPVRISQRLVVNYFTAKRLWLALGAFLQRHEQTFGEVQIDINKRVLPQRPQK